jgi:protein tyrosine/serine phosphatase
LTSTQRAASRILNWEGCFNVRDLGGLAAGRGHRLRWGTLVRSDLPVRLTDRGRQALVDHGVRLIVDLRFVDEVVVDWESYPFKGDEVTVGPAYRNVPFHQWGGNGPDEQHVALYRAAQSRGELIQLDLDLNRDGIAAAVAAIADAPEGAVLVHCHAGKDRTGVVVALILSLLGVSDSDIADDYTLTAQNLEPLILEWLNSMSDDPDERQRLREMAMPAHDAMLGGLAYLRSRYGSAEAYLRAGGVSDEQLATLRERLLEPVQHVDEIEAA